MSVEICSGEGNGRVSSENCTMRAGVGSTATVTRSMAAAGGFDSRSSKASVRSVRASRIGTGSCNDRSCTSRVVPSVLIKCRRTCSTAAPRSRCSRCASSRLHQAPEHERERLELLDRPLEIERLLESLFGHGRHQRTRVFPASQTLPVRLLTAKTCGKIIGRQCREIAQRPQTPATEGGDQIRDPGSGIRDSGVRGSSSEFARFASSGQSQSESRINRSPSKAIGSGATAAASFPGSTIVSPARCRTSNRAAVRVPAMATRTRNPRSAAVRRSSSAIVRASPNNRVRPLRSSTISVRAAHLDSRRELARDLRQHTGRSAFDCRQRTEHRSPSSPVGRVLLFRPAGSKNQDPAYG